MHSLILGNSFGTKSETKTLDPFKKALLTDCVLGNDGNILTKEQDILKKKCQVDF